MSGTEALQVFQNNLDRGFEAEEALDLVRALDYIPLAVKQAASYINSRGFRASLRSYIEGVQDTATMKAKLLLHDSGDLRRYEDALNSIVLMWKINLDHIMQDHPTAADLLSLMSSLMINAIDGNRRAHGDNSPHTLNSKRMLAFIYRYQGRWREAELLTLQLIESWGNLFAADHRHNSQSRADLAHIYCDQLRWKDVEPLIMRRVDELKHELGDMHAPLTP
jgi:hypothetical protein